MMSNQRVGISRGGHRTLGATVSTLLAIVCVFAVSSCSSSSTDSNGNNPGASASASAGLPASDPTSLDIKKINVHVTSMVSLGLNSDNSIEVPPVNQPEEVGWYNKGPTPGQTGPSVLLGHVDGRDAKGNAVEGVFFRLHELAANDQFTIGRKDGKTLTFVVDHVDKVAKAQFPTDAVYGNTSRPEVRLITCGGDFDQKTHNYLDNYIVYAHEMT